MNTPRSYLHAFQVILGGLVWIMGFLIAKATIGT